MATPTYDLIEAVTLDASSTSVTFSNIDTVTYRDLVLVYNGVQASGTDFFPAVRINGNTFSSYRWMTTAGFGSNNFQQNFSGSDNVIKLNNSSFLDTQSSGVVEFIGAGDTNKYKSLMFTGGRATSAIEMAFGALATFSRISSIEFRGYSGGSLASGFTINLYGVIA